MTVMIVLVSKIGLYVVSFTSQFGFADKQQEDLRRDYRHDIRPSLCIALFSCH